MSLTPGCCQCSTIPWHLPSVPWQLSCPWVSLLLVWGGSVQTQHITAEVLPRIETVPNLSLLPPFLSFPVTGCPQHSLHGLLSCLWSKHPMSSSSGALGVWGLWGYTGWLPSSTGSLCHHSLTKVPHLQHAREGWRRRATTVGPATTKSAAQGSATAARSSSGRAASCARPADTARSAEVPAGRGSGTEGLCPGLWHRGLLGELLG